MKHLDIICNNNIIPEICNNIENKKTFNISLFKVFLSFNKMAVRVVIFGGNTNTKCLEDRTFSGFVKL